MSWTAESIEWWRERDLNPPPGFMPFLELAGRSWRLNHARTIAGESGVPINEDDQAAIIQLFNIYYDDLLSKLKSGSIET